MPGMLMSDRIRIRDGSAMASTRSSAAGADSSNSMMKRPERRSCRKCWRNMLSTSGSSSTTRIWVLKLCLAVHRMEGEIAAIIARRAPPLGDQERQQLLQLGADLERAWTHPAATAATRKRILRTVLNEIVVRRDGAIIHAVLHWQGGSHTALQINQ